MGNSSRCISLFLQFFARLRVHGADNCLPTSMHMNMLDRDFLLPLATVPLESLYLHRESPQ